MKLFYWPVNPVRLNQGFGENKGCIDNATNSKVISCDGLNPPEGYRSVYSTMKGHNGLDLMAVRWQPVYAAREGVVREVETEPARGLGAGIDHDFGAQGRWKTRYWHLCAIDVHIGDKVYTGQLIGYADNTGYSAGDHLHFEVKPLSADGSNMYPDNGFYGGVDPWPLMFDDFARNINVLRMTIETLASMVEKLIDRMRATKTGTV